jgi:CopG family transcriptional regulator, nickel-responsive regulator
MNKLVRFGISMEDDLLHQFDHLIARKGYTNRSEAIRDIVRDKLVEESIETTTGNVFGALVFIYDHHKRELEKSLSNLQHDYFQNIISTSHVHVDHDHCMEVVLLKGSTKILKNIAEKLLSFKGVKHGRLTLTTALQHTHQKYTSLSEKPHTHHQVKK